MTDETQGLSDAAFPSAAAGAPDPAVLAPKIIAFNVPGHQVKCGNDISSANPRFLYTDTVPDVPEMVAAFLADHPGATRAAGPMRSTDFVDLSGPSLHCEADF